MGAAETSELRTLAPRIMVVGRGRVGTALVALLVADGQPPCHWWSRRDGSSADTLPPADLILLAVADTAIDPVAASLASRPNAANEVWLHCSGARPASVLRQTPTVPAAVGCIHPLHAVDGGPVARGYFSGSTAGIDGEPRATRVATLLAELFEMRPVALTADTKPLYHAAAVMVAGHAMALFAHAQAMLSHCDLTELETRGMLQPLMAGAVANLSGSTAATAITGPSVRGDVDVVAAHLDAVATHEPNSLALYRCLATKAVELSQDSLAPSAVSELTRILQDDGPADGPT